MDTRAVLYMTFYIELCAYAPHGSRGPQVLGAEKHKNQQMFLSDVSATERRASRNQLPAGFPWPGLEVLKHRCSCSQIHGHG